MFLVFVSNHRTQFQKLFVIVVLGSLGTKHTQISVVIGIGTEQTLKYPHRNEQSSLVGIRSR